MAAGVPFLRSASKEWFGPIAAMLLLTLIVGCSESTAPALTPRFSNDHRAVALPTGAPTYRVIHAYGENYGYATTDGFSPHAALLEVGGILYGTTMYGGGLSTGAGTSHGTVFSIEGGKTERVLYRFGGTPDGDHPGPLTTGNDSLFGTTLKGGAYDYGSIYSLTASGTEKVIHSFGQGMDGRYPMGIVYINGILYGTTLEGGAYDRGVIFQITPEGGERVLWSFGKGADGAFPYAGLLPVGDTLFGTTYFGGQSNGGTIYGVAPSGKNYRILHNFGNRGGSDGFYPMAALTDLHGTLFGTTLNGGTSTACDGNDGCGTVFAIDPSGAQYRVLFSFSDANFGAACPEAPLVALDGVLYGTTTVGGANRQTGGTIFSVTTSGSEAVLHSFASNIAPTEPDGENPVAGLTAVNGVLYGTTPWGGKYGGGVAFALSIAGTTRR